MLHQTNSDSNNKKFSISSYYLLQRFSETKRVELAINARIRILDVLKLKEDIRLENISPVFIYRKRLQSHKNCQQNNLLAGKFYIFSIVYLTEFIY